MTKKPDWEEVRNQAERDQKHAALVENLTKACGALYGGFMKEGLDKDQAFELVALYLEETVHMYLDEEI
jgi:hypothetical protein